MVQTKFRVRITATKRRQEEISREEDLVSRITDLMEDITAAAATGKTRVFLQCG